MNALLSTSDLLSQVVPLALNPYDTGQTIAMFKSFHTFELPVRLLALLAVPAYTDLPYNPTRAFQSPNHAGELVYVFQPTSISSSSFRLFSLNTTTTLNTGDLPYKTISISLPFLTGGDGVAFTPIMDEWGNISVYAGKCADNGRGGQLWRFTQDNRTSNGDGSWAKESLSIPDADGNGGLAGPNYLSTGIPFLSTVGQGQDSPELYIFGGMCPTATGSSDSWTSSAQYSNSMLKLTPAKTSSTPSALSAYRLGITAGRGPPIPEAGYSITGLNPSFSNTSDGEKIRQQNFVLLGGHTQQAFINTSQVAIFSLPEESWSFQDVDLPSRTTNIDPRSGHTAVLTPDGERLVVFGGWVGDVGTPAEPQLVVLELGEGYGGSGNWTWTLPTQTGSGLDKGTTGVYGHGAVMLPGDVMMVVGGYSISASSKSQTKRADMFLNTHNVFYNVTSNSWLSTYTKPPPTPPSSGSSKANTDSPTTSKRAGIGTGLALGLAAIIGAGLVWFWLSRRSKRRREAREKELRELALGAQRFHSSGLGLGGIDGRGGEKSAMDWMGEQQRVHRNAYGVPRNGGFGEGPGWKEYGGTEAERTGLLVEIPSPTRGLRRSLHSRGAYQQAARFDDPRRSLVVSSIHPIEERDEYEIDTIEPVAVETETPQDRPARDIVSSAPHLDPFGDPAPLGSHPVPSRTPPPLSSARERELEVQSWVSDWTAADDLLHNTGRNSPDKADRTSSTLSELSTRSGLSAHSIQRSTGTISRSMSQLSGAFFSTNPFSTATNTTNSSPTFDRPSSAGGGRRSSTTSYPRPDYRRSRSLALVSRHSHNLSDTSSPTAATTFPQLQTEGEALLGGRPDWASTLPESPTKPRSRATGWIGSMRRSLTGGGGERSHSASPDNGARSTTSSPTKYHRNQNQDGVGDEDLPRRAASAGAMLWRRRQGARDWDVEGCAGGGPLDAGGSHEEHGADGEDAGAEEEWDVEAAVERRVVQVMFTVPKEKLRVVNGEVDGLSVSDVSDAVVEGGDVKSGETEEEGPEEVADVKGTENREEFRGSEI